MDPKNDVRVKILAKTVILSEGLRIVSHGKLCSVLMRWEVDEDTCSNGKGFALLKRFGIVTKVEIH